MWGAMPPLPKAKALKRDHNVGLDLELQVGQPTKLANLLQVLGTVPGTWYFA